jgi:hypothetical protein
VNSTEIHARLYRIGLEQETLMRRIEEAAFQVREAATASDVSAGSFALLNRGLMLEKVAVIAADGVAARRLLQELSIEKKRLEGGLNE